MKRILFAIAVGIFFILVFNVSHAISGEEKGEHVILPDGTPAYKAKDNNVITPIKDKLPNVADNPSSDPNTGTLGYPDIDKLNAVASVDKPTADKILLAWRGYYDYRSSGYQHRSRVFEWQLLSSKIIFFVVVFLVIAGIYFAYVQFQSDLSKKGKKNIDHGNTPTEISMGKEGIKVSSPILGVIILVISFLFFYMYLIYVYPIEDKF